MKNNLDLSALEGKKVLITGACGLIGKALVTALLTYKGKKPISVIAVVRDELKARKVFCELPQENLEYLIGDVCEIEPINLGIDFIIHGASITASRAFIAQPVDVIKVSVKGTENLLEFARVNEVESFVYLSSMEVYGTYATDEKIYENSATFLDTTSVRSSYPESKRLCESLCVAYQSQYGVPVKIVRLTQTFGEGVAYDDKRVFAEFARCAIEKRNIVLKTKGETKRNYLYIGDAVNALLTVLLHGKSGEAYNAANKDTYCSIYDMALLVANEFGEGKVKVVFDFSMVENLGFAPEVKINLATGKLEALGWKATTDLITMFKKTILFMKNNMQQ